MTKLLRLAFGVCPLLILIFILLVALSYLLLTRDLPPEWPSIDVYRSPTAPAPITQVHLTGPIAEYGAVWTRPLFNSGRQPDGPNEPENVVAPVPPLTDITLTGIVLADPVGVAMVNGPDGQGATYHVGETLPNGWTLKDVRENRVEFTYGPVHQTLEVASPKLPLILP